jgi:hypothetical protein
MPIKQRGQAETAKRNMLMVATESVESASKYIIKYLTISDKSCILIGVNNA